MVALIRDDPKLTWHWRLPGRLEAAAMSWLPIHRAGEERHRGELSMSIVRSDKKMKRAEAVVQKS